MLTELGREPIIVEVAEWLAMLLARRCPIGRAGLLLSIGNPGFAQTLGHTGDDLRRDTP